VNRALDVAGLAFLDRELQTILIPELSIDSPEVRAYGPPQGRRKLNKIRFLARGAS
jgi:hypothetical protein